MPVDHELDNFVTPLSDFMPGPYSRAIRKTIYTLNVTPDGLGTYAPELCELTYPLMQAYADKIGADFHVIKTRTSSRTKWPVTIEKFQVGELAREREDEWSIFFDSDTLISPEFFDVTEHMSKDTVAHNGNDMSHVRFKADKYFRRDGRWFGSCTWCVIASEWCVEDLWQLPQQEPPEAYANIAITVQEHNSGQCKTEHLIDDYTLSRNIARFGLKTTTINDICGKLGWRDQGGRGVSPFLWHLYTLPEKEKLARMLAVLSTPKEMLIPNPQNPQAPPLGVGWGLMDPDTATALRKKWGLR